MPQQLPADFLSTVTTVTAIATLIIGGLVTILSLAFLGGRVARRRSAQAGLRAAFAASILLIALAGLDMYLAVQRILGA